MDAREALAVVVAGKTLTRAEAESAMGSVMAGEATPAQLGALLAALSMRGETPDEIAGFASVLRANALRVVIEDGAIDVVGTGGDRSSSINISTITALVVAGAGGRVAKHGNRAASSQCGSADVLEALGVKIDLGPAGVRRYLLGVPSVALGDTMARALVELGAERALVVYGMDGLDEISPSAETRTWEVSPSGVRDGALSPVDLGFKPATRAEITGGDPATNASAARRVLDGEAGGARTAVLMNAAAACYIAGLAGSVREGLDVASRSIDSGKARETLVRFAAKSQLIGAAEAATA